MEAFQLSVGVIDTPIVPLEGDESIGEEGAAPLVVKLQVVEYALVPPVFAALTRQ